MSEFDPDDYEEKRKHLAQRAEILAAWIAMVFIALLFISWESFRGGTQQVVWHQHRIAPAIAFVDPSDRIDWSDEEDGDGGTTIDREETRKVCPGPHATQ